MNINYGFVIFVMTLSFNLLRFVKLMGLEYDVFCFPFSGYFEL